MKFYDEFDLLDHFNKVCGEVAQYITSPNFFQELDARATEITIPCDMQFHDIDEWWGVDHNGQNFMELYLHALKTLKNRDKGRYDDHFKVGFDMLENFPNLDAHLKAKLDKSAVKEADMIRYLPHKVSYAYNAFLELDGFKKLQQTMQLLDNVDMDIVLMPKNDGDDIHAPLTYDLVIVLEASDGQALVSKFKSFMSTRQFH